MTINILMPALSPTMTEGTLATWHKKEGDKVKSGDVIAEIETDKATMEVEAVDEGTIGKILVAEGTENVPVNEVIAILLEEGEDAGALKGGAPAAKPEAKAEAPAEPKAEAAPAPAEQPTPAAKPAANGHDDSRVFASPLARRMAQQAGIDLAALQGSGPHGRIVRADVAAALAGGAPAAKPAAAAPEAAKPSAAPAATPAAKPAAAGPNAKQLADAYGIPYSEQKHSNMRKTVARRLLESKQTVPHFYLTVDIELDALLKLRKELNDRGDVKLSVNDLIIKAAALALRKVPAANASWTDEAMIQYERVDVSVAVATEGGLITPIIKDADRKGLGTISGEMKDLAARAREGKLKPEEYQGGPFSISNLGMFGVKAFAAIITPPQSCILAVGAGTQRAVVKDGALAIATVMSCTLSVDHRAVDGAVGAEYLAAFKALVEAPLSMML
ncbi:pyruvate dehydrogenase complex dihydrolipoamide acetyltransferase [Inquilinus sp. Marseille-Q2685]|uniref:pyruvate dehydrogenase complex dihydrolipoamide acetyltransferase n=1 Tax=Inquilinus sp. Marseille-Q2685 TaxID=2866581 RepID=UPI001CE44ACF|nr:pyruvate dehydrogenase complex dihydrolipoamide acetyltransferase [Inquilinus sp. Marseille-Q2685]